jgi:hypothetical protein
MQITLPENTSSGKEARLEDETSYGEAVPSAYFILRRELKKRDLTCGHARIPFH